MTAAERQLIIRSLHTQARQCRLAARGRKMAGPANAEQRRVFYAEAESADALADRMANEGS